MSDQVLAAYAKAWAAARGDLARYLKSRSPVDSARFQAALADTLRNTLPIKDGFAKEKMVQRNLLRVRVAIATLEQLGPDATFAQASKAWSSEAGMAATIVQDRARTTARDEILAKMKGLTWTWKATLDHRTCSYCIARHGHVFPVGAPFESHPNCRCIPVAEIKSEVPGLVGGEWKQSSYMTYSGGMNQARKAGVPNDHGIEPVPISYLQDIAGNPTNDEDVDFWMRKIRDDGGLSEEIDVSYDPDTQRVEVGEGNNRVEALFQLGYKYAPVRVSKTFGVTGGRKVVPIVTGDESGWIPHDLAPSWVGMPTAPDTAPPDGWSWLRDQSEEVQDQVLGRVVAEAWRAGTLEEADIIDFSAHKRRSLGTIFGRQFLKAYRQVARRR